MKKLIAICIICSLIFFTLTGCAPKIDLINENAAGLLEGKELDLYLEQIGKPMDEVFEAFSLTEDQMTDTFHGVTWLLPTTREIEGEAFSQELFFERSEPNNLYSYRYTFHPEEYDEDEFRELAVSIALNAVELHGDSLHADGLNLFNNAGNVIKNRNDTYIETWELSENEALRFHADIKHRYIWLDYRVQTGLYMDDLKRASGKMLE